MVQRIYSRWENRWETVEQYSFLGYFRVGKNLISLKDKAFYFWTIRAIVSRSGQLAVRRFIVGAIDIEVIVWRRERFQQRRVLLELRGLRQHVVTW